MVFAKKFENYPYRHKLPGHKLRVPYCNICSAAELKKAVEEAKKKEKEAKEEAERKKALEEAEKQKAIQAAKKLQEKLDCKSLFASEKYVCSFTETDSEPSI